jgi:hypothetical protein
VNAEMRVRFTSPHPKDFTDDVLQVTHKVLLFWPRTEQLTADAVQACRWQWLC